MSYRHTGYRIIDQQRAQWRDTPEALAQRLASNRRLEAVRAELDRLFPEGITLENVDAYSEAQRDLLHRADASSSVYDANDPLWKAVR